MLKLYCTKTKKTTLISPRQKHILVSIGWAKYDHTKRRYTIDADLSDPEVQKNMNLIYEAAKQPTRRVRK